MQTGQGFAPNSRNVISKIQGTVNHNAEIAHRIDESQWGSVDRVGSGRENDNSNVKMTKREAETFNTKKTFIYKSIETFPGLNFAFNFFSAWLDRQMPISMYILQRLAITRATIWCFFDLLLGS